VLRASCLVSTDIKRKINKIIILLVLCGCELGLTIRNINLRFSENRLLRRIFGPKKEVEGG
jgi:hypothetical protein